MSDDVKQPGKNGSAGGRIAVVLSGGGARGAYEIGVLSVLAPVLAQREEQIRIIVGTSVGALNGAFLAAEAQRELVGVVRDGVRMWRELVYGDVLGPLVSVRELGRGLRYGLQFLGLTFGSVASVLDNGPVADTISARVSFDKLAENVRAGVVETAGVIATSYDTGRSVVFHDGASSPARDDVRGIDYARTRLSAEHVRASAAIEALFPAVEVTEPVAAGGWYGDGGTSLNTPLKPVLAFGAERVIVIGLNSIAGSARAGAMRPVDAFDGAAQALQALLADQLAHDVASLATINQIVAARLSTAQHDSQTADAHRVIPYIFVAPRERFAIGRLASDIYRQRYAGVSGLRRARDLALLGRLLDAARNQVRGELFSYLFFAPEFAAALIEQGRLDAHCWLEQQHDDGPWRVGDPPGNGHSRPV